MKKSTCVEIIFRSKKSQLALFTLMEYYYQRIRVISYTSFVLLYSQNDSVKMIDGYLCEMITGHLIHKDWYSLHIGETLLVQLEMLEPLFHRTEEDVG